jgi:tripartite-type tricarboxylate transporter receptor subunit TctC
MEETGQSDFVVTSWAAFVVPAGTPRPIIDRLAATVHDIAGVKAIQERFLKAGAKILSSTPEAAKQHADQERARWREIVRIAGAKAE